MNTFIWSLWGYCESSKTILRWPFFFLDHSSNDSRISLLKGYIYLCVKQNLWHRERLYHCFMQNAWTFYRETFRCLICLLPIPITKLGDLLFVLSAKGITCTVTWNSDLEMIVYIVFSCILENDLFVKREECVSLSFQCQFVALNNNDHGMANWFNQRPNGKDWIVSLNGQHLFTTGEYNHCSEHFWSWMLAVFSRLFS